MEQYETINLYLDNDKTGQNCSRNAIAISKKYKDKSELYKHYKDLNDWLVNVGKSQNFINGFYK